MQFFVVWYKIHHNGDRNKEHNGAVRTWNGWSHRSFLGESERVHDKRLAKKGYDLLLVGSVRLVRLADLDLIHLQECASRLVYREGYE